MGDNILQRPTRLVKELVSDDPQSALFFLHGGLRHAASRSVSSQPAFYGMPGCPKPPLTSPPGCGRFVCAVRNNVVETRAGRGGC